MPFLVTLIVVAGALGRFGDPAAAEALVARARGEGTTLVISPLIALMNDQVESLKAQGVAAAAMHSSQECSFCAPMPTTAISMPWLL